MGYTIQTCTNCHCSEDITIDLTLYNGDETTLIDAHLCIRCLTTQAGEIIAAAVATDLNDRILNKKREHFLYAPHPHTTP